MEVQPLRVSVKVDTLEAEDALARLEETLDRIIEKQELVAGRMNTILHATREQSDSYEGSEV